MKPDKIATTYTVFSPERKIPPNIIFGTRALKWIAALVDLHTHEVGFYAAVDKREEGTYFIRDVFYPKHSEAHGATCEISPEGETDMINWLCDNGKEEDIEKIRLWGHSHHTMDTGPSKQDEDQAMERMKDTQSFLIRVICNKDGEMACSFFDYENQIRFDHIKWTVEEDDASSYAESKMETINTIMADTGKPAIDKIKDIKKLSSEDNETSEIRAKIKELKELNLPKATTYPHDNDYYYMNYHNNWGGRQQNMFPSGKVDKKKNKKNGSKSKVTYLNNHGGLPKSKDSFEEDEVEEMLRLWEEQSFGV